MLGISLILTAVSAVLFIVLLFVWGTPAISNISIRAPTQNSSIIAYIQGRFEQRKKSLILSEISDAELFIARMLKSGVNTVHETIGITANMTVRLKPFFQRCYNRYFSGGTDAIAAMKQELSDDGFSVLCDALIHAASFNRQEMGEQVSEHLLAFLIVQLYPWLVQALEQLSVIYIY